MDAACDEFIRVIAEFRNVAFPGGGESSNLSLVGEEKNYGIGDGGKNACTGGKGREVANWGRGTANGAGTAVEIWPGDVLEDGRRRGDVSVSFEAEVGEDFL